MPHQAARARSHAVPQHHAPTCAALGAHAALQIRASWALEAVQSAIVRLVRVALNLGAFQAALALGILVSVALVKEGRAWVLLKGPHLQCGSTSWDRDRVALVVKREHPLRTPNAAAKPPMWVPRAPLTAGQRWKHVSPRPGAWARRVGTQLGGERSRNRVVRWVQGVQQAVGCSAADCMLAGGLVGARTSSLAECYSLCASSPYAPFVQF